MTPRTPGDTPAHGRTVPADRRPGQETGAPPAGARPDRQRRDLDFAGLADDPRKHQNETWLAYATRRRFQVCGRVLRHEAWMREYHRQLALAPPSSPAPDTALPSRRKTKRGRR